MYDMATSPSLTLSQAVDLLRRNARLRTVAEILFQYAGVPAGDSKALQTLLLDRLLVHSPPDTKRETLGRKIRMWLGGDIQSLSKQGAIQLCFALDLSYEDANRFLHRACGEGFHWRDPEELVFLYALREKMTYPQAIVLRDNMAKKNLLTSTHRDSETYTELVHQDAEHIKDLEELENFLRQFQGKLGSFHNTAYALFRDYLNLLCAPETNDLLDTDKKFSVREVTSTYLHEAIVSRFKKTVAKESPTVENQIFSAIQRDIQQNWPDEITLSRMLHRKTDVSRKALILLFLATDGATASDSLDDDFLDEDEEEENFESRYARLNAMLCDCGFSPMDSRSPFDWMVIYCMCIDEAMFIDAEIDAFLSVIFQQPSSHSQKE